MRTLEALKKLALKVCTDKNESDLAGMDTTDKLLNFIARRKFSLGHIPQKIAQIVQLSNFFVFVRSNCPNCPGALLKRPAPAIMRVIKKALDGGRAFAPARQPAFIRKECCLYETVH